MGSRQLRPEIRGILNSLRGRIRRYVILEGIALVLIVLAVLFWLSMGIDAAWFQITRLELPSWFRTGFLILAVCLFVFTFLSWIVSRLGGRFDDKGLALVLERRFPQLNDRLITAVESPLEDNTAQSSLSAAMLDRTIDDVSGLSKQLDISSVFEKRPLRRALIGAAVLIASVFAFGALNAQAMERWWDAYVNRADNYWERTTTLEMRVVARPDDRIREFEKQGDRYIYRHPRGSDLSLLISVPQDDERQWIVPDRVQLDIHQTDNSRSRVYLSSNGEREFRFTVNQLQSNVSLYVRGGDYTNRLPYVVTVVDPPRVDRVEFDCDYPQYTRLSERTDTTVVLQDAQVTLPMWTQYAMRVNTNKTLSRIRVLADRWQYESDDNGSTLLVRGENGKESKFTLADSTTAAMDGQSFTVPMSLTPTAATDLDELLANPSQTVTAVPQVPDSVLRIYIEDQHGIMNSEPVRMTISGRPDNAPVVKTRRRGIGDVITRKATIPIEGQVFDDYGLERVRFDFRVDDEPDWRLRPLKTQPKNVPEEFVLQRTAEQPFEFFEALPLDLQVGQKLTLTVYAEDGDTLSGPNKSRGEEYVFRIVSNEELLSILYAREVNLRRRFEQIITEVKRTRAELQSLENRPSSETDPNDADQPGGLGLSAASIAVRSQASIRKNATETLAIEDAFREILEELVNNSVHTRQMMDRMDNLIVKRLANINTTDFPDVDVKIGEFRLSTEQNVDFKPRISRSLVSIDTMLRHMQLVLDEIQDLAEFHEALRDLQAIIDAQKELSDKTRETQKKKLIDNLKLLD